MIIRTTTNHPEEEVRKLLFFAAHQVDDLVHKHLLVKVKNTGRAYYGRAFSFLCSEQDVKTGAYWLVTIGVGDNFPTVAGRRPPVVYHTWQEALVSVAAHEFAHIRDWQQGVPCPSEKTANIEGRLALNEFRKGA